MMERELAARSREALQTTLAALREQHAYACGRRDQLKDDYDRFAAMLESMRAGQRPIDLDTRERRQAVTRARVVVRERRLGDGV